MDRYASIPAQKSLVVSTASDNQSSVEIAILQGKCEFARDNILLGNFLLDGILPAQRGIPQIEIIFDIDANNILTVSARDKGTGHSQRLTITGESGSRIARESRSDLPLAPVVSSVVPAQPHQKEPKDRLP